MYQQFSDHGRGQSKFSDRHHTCIYISRDPLKNNYEVRLGLMADPVIALGLLYVDL